MNGIYNAARLEAARAVKAANIYKELLGIINQAKNSTQDAQIKSAMARKAGRGKVVFVDLFVIIN